MYKHLLEVAELTAKPEVPEVVSQKCSTQEHCDCGDVCEDDLDEVCACGADFDDCDCDEDDFRDHCGDCGEHFEDCECDEEEEEIEEDEGEEELSPLDVMFDRYRRFDPTK